MADVEGSGPVEVSNNDCVDLEITKSIEEDPAKGIKRKLEEAVSPVEEPKLNGSAIEEKENGSSNGHGGIPAEKNGHSDEPKDSPVKKAKTDVEETKEEEMITIPVEEKTENVVSSTPPEIIKEDEKKESASEKEILDEDMKDAVDVDVEKNLAEEKVVEEDIAEDKVESAETPDASVDDAKTAEAEDKAE